MNKRKKLTPASMLSAEDSLRDEESDAPPALALTEHEIEPLPTPASVAFVIENAKVADVEPAEVAAVVHVAVNLDVVVAPAMVLKPNSPMIYKSP